MIKFKGGHNIPRLTGKDGETFVKFIEDEYKRKFDKGFPREVRLSEEFKQKYLSEKKGFMEAKL